ncbi:MAG: CDP-diacylglycerol--glycerol-3-phosphate 3-phosphatidyltransferase [Desulfobacterales bacterium]|jgi:CDP-diacylglycerol--glycerol-3-phosphate 3-phosphatidyltransferase|nr:CDP-diacylglycerol--glycerol-3-phosphate 3-phosphatidyltransferase [Desulfobacterales bacterium]
MNPTDLSSPPQPAGPGSAAGSPLSMDAVAASAEGPGAPAGIWGRFKDATRHPNGLTLIRVAIIPLIILLFSFPNRFLAFCSALLFSVAAATDYFDGFLARRHGKVTLLGKIMDPVADKLLNSSALIMLAAHGWAPAWMVCVIIGRELTVTGLRSVIAGKGADVSASPLGKLKTGFQVAAIIPLMIHFPLFGLDCQAIGMVLLWLALGFTVWSAVDYFIKFKKIL